MTANRIRWRLLSRFVTSPLSNQNWRIFSHPVNSGSWCTTFYKNENRKNRQPKSKTEVQQQNIWRKGCRERSPPCVEELSKPPQTRGYRRTFYLQPIDNPREGIWYKKLPLKRDGLASIMKRMVAKAEIQNEGKLYQVVGSKNNYSKVF